MSLQSVLFAPHMTIDQYKYKVQTVNHFVEIFFSKWMLIAYFIYLFFIYFFKIFSTFNQRTFCKFTQDSVNS